MCPPLSRREHAMSVGRRRCVQTDPLALPRYESPAPQAADVRPFVMAIRSPVDSEHLAAARQMLDAAPAYISADPVVTRLRALLAPPVVKRVERRDVDRTEEYQVD